MLIYYSVKTTQAEDVETYLKKNLKSASPWLQSNLVRSKNLH